MSLYEGIKDAAKIVQKADYIELYQKLLDLSSQALDLQAQIQKLTEENSKLKEKLSILQRIIRHESIYVTLSDDDQKLPYCAHCWDADKKLIQVKVLDDGHFFCPHCKTKAVYDHAKAQASYATSMRILSKGINFD